MRKEVWLTEFPSVFNLLHLMKERAFPIKGVADFGTIRGFYEALLPAKLMQVFRYKTSSPIEKNANTSWLHRGDPAANGRRRELVSLLCDNGAEGAKYARAMTETVAEKLLVDQSFREGALLKELLLRTEDCIPFSAQTERKRQYYLSCLNYYIEKDMSYALMCAMLCLLAGDYAGRLQELLFSGKKLVSGDDSAGALQLLYDAGRYEETYRQAEKIIGKKDVSAEDKIRAYYLTGELLRTGATGRTDLTGALRALRAGDRLAKGKDADCCYALFSVLRELARTAEEKKEAASYLKRACDMGRREAVLEMASCLLRGEPVLQIKKNAAKARTLYAASATQNDGAFLYGLGLAEETLGHPEQAQDAYLRAQRAGYRGAAYRLNLLRLRAAQTKHAAQTKSKKKTPLPARMVFFNAPKEARNEAFLTSLPANDGQAWVTEPLQEGFFERVLPQLPASFPQAEETDWIFLLFHPDAERNMADAARIVDAFNASGADAKEQMRMTRHVRIFLSGSGNEMIDAMRTDALNDLYKSAKETGLAAPCYRIRLCDEVRDASLYLLSHVPLFLRDADFTPGEEAVLWKHYDVGPVTLVGGGALALRLLRDIPAVAPYRNAQRDRIPVSVIAEDAGALRGRLMTEAPAFFAEDRRRTPRTDLTFFDTPFEEWMRMLRDPAGDEDTPMMRTLYDTRYFIFCDADETKNAQGAILLREALLRRRPDGARSPVICAFIRTPQLARSLTMPGAQGTSAGTWYGGYHIVPFGMTDTLFSYQTLCDSRIEKRALRLHLSYYDDVSEDRMQAEDVYYGSFYNRDSSVMNAISAIYAAAAAGLTLGDPFAYGTAAEQALAAPYEAYLADGSHLDEAAAHEHERWRFLLYSRGWQQASLAQAERYIRAGNPSHRLTVAKLHPYLCAFDELDALGEKFNRMMRAQDAAWRDRDVKKADDTLVKKGAALLGME